MSENMLAVWREYSVRAIATTVLLDRRAYIIAAIRSPAGTSVVSFDGVPVAEWRAALAEIDAELNERIPASLVINYQSPTEPDAT